MAAMAGAAISVGVPLLMQMLQGTPKSQQTQNFAPMIGTENARQQSLLDLIAKTPPQFNPISVNDLNKLIEQQSMLSAYKSKLADRELNPEVATMRDLENKDLLSSYQGALHGDLPVGVQNALVRAGLGSAIGNGSRISPTSLGKGTAERVFGMGTTDYLDKLRSLISQKASSTPMPVTTLDPSSAGQIHIGNIKDRDTLNNQFQQQLLQATGQANNNMSNLTNSLAEASAREANANLAAKTAKQGQDSGIFSGIGGALGKMDWGKILTSQTSTGGGGGFGMGFGG